VHSERSAKANDKPEIRSNNNIRVETAVVISGLSVIECTWYNIIGKVYTLYWDTEKSVFVCFCVLLFASRRFLSLPVKRNCNSTPPLRYYIQVMSRSAGRRRLIGPGRRLASLYYIIYTSVRDVILWRYCIYRHGESEIYADNFFAIHFNKPRCIQSVHYRKVTREKKKTKISFIYNTPRRGYNMYVAGISRKRNSLIFSPSKYYRKLRERKKIYYK